MSSLVNQTLFKGFGSRNLSNECHYKLDSFLNNVHVVCIIDYYTVCVICGSLLIGFMHAGVEFLIVYVIVIVVLWLYILLFLYMQVCVDTLMQCWINVECGKHNSLA